MAYDIKKLDIPHNVIIEGRSRMNITGVEDVESFDEESVIAVTSAGVLCILGYDLHIERLSLDVGELVIEGTVSSLAYEEEQRSSGGFFRRLFK